MSEPNRAEAGTQRALTKAEVLADPTLTDGWGGAKPGAGRKTTRERNAVSIAETERLFFTAARNLRNLRKLQTIADNPVVEQEIVTEDGVKVKVKRPRYSGTQQLNALKELLNRGMGVPVQRSDVKADVSVLLPQLVIMPRANDEPDNGEPT